MRDVDRFLWIFAGDKPPQRLISSSPFPSVSFSGSSVMNTF